jgi:ribose transport system permease protein
MRPHISLRFDRLSGLYFWALIVLVFGIWKTQLFLTQGTLHSVASEQAISASLAIAVLIPLCAGAYDLSVGANLTLSTILVTWLQTGRGWPMWPAIAMTVVVACSVGVLNGFFVVVLKINSFIATLGMATVLAAVQSIITNQVVPFPVVKQSWIRLTQFKLGGFQIVVLYLLVLALIVWWLLEHTPPGRYVYAAGGNPEAARLAGVNVDKWVWLSLVASATISGLAGVFSASLTGPSLTVGSALLLPAFAAAFLSSTQLTPGRFNVWGTLLAVYVLATGVEGLQLVTGVQWLNNMFNGVALIGAVAFATWRQRRAARPRQRYEDGILGQSTDGPTLELQHPAVVAPDGSAR